MRDLRAGGTGATVLTPGFDAPMEAAKAGRGGARGEEGGGSWMDGGAEWMDGVAWRGVAWVVWG